MTEQATVEADLRNQELKGFKDSMALLAGAIAGDRANSMEEQERGYNNYQTSIVDNGKTCFIFCKKLYSHQGKAHHSDLCGRDQSYSILSHHVLSLAI